MLILLPSTCIDRDYTLTFTQTKSHLVSIIRLTELVSRFKIRDLLQRLDACNDSHECMSEVFLWAL